MIMVTKCTVSVSSFKTPFLFKSRGRSAIYLLSTSFQLTQETSAWIVPLFYSTAKPMRLRLLLIIIAKCFVTVFSRYPSLERVSFLFFAVKTIISSAYFCCSHFVMKDNWSDCNICVSVCVCDRYASCADTSRHVS